MRRDNTTIGPLSGRFAPNWTISDVLDHYAVHDALPTGLSPDLLRRVDEALTPGIRWHHQARAEALIRSLVMQVQAAPAKGAIRISRLLDDPRAARAPRHPRPATVGERTDDRAGSFLPSAG